MRHFVLTILCTVFVYDGNLTQPGSSS